ncbi:hypothetical protein CB1_000365075 [Camelus ferus]|nr:hypothetical protein CB1_000365075 [Camelus ferus]
MNGSGLEQSLWESQVRGRADGSNCPTSSRQQPPQQSLSPGPGSALLPDVDILGTVSRNSPRAVTTDPCLVMQLDVSCFHSDHSGDTALAEDFISSSNL